MTTNGNGSVGDAVHFNDYPDDLWGCYGIITEMTEKSMHVSVQINGTAVQSLEFLEGSATDTTGLFTRVMPDAPNEPVVSSLRGAFGSLLAQWEHENNDRRAAMIDWDSVS